MKYLLGLFLLLLSNFTIGQKIYRAYDQVIINEDFNPDTKGWSQKNTPNEIFVVTQDQYYLHRLSRNFFSMAFPEEHKEYNNFEIKSKIKVAKNKGNKNASAGLVFRAQSSGDEAIVFEFSNQKKFRIQVIRQGSLRPLFKNDDGGWFKCPDLNTYKYNEINIKAEGNTFDLYINDKFQKTFIESHFKPGAIGFFVNANTEAYVDNISIAVSSRENFVKQNSSQKEEPVSTSTNSYEEVLLIFRKKISKQQEQIEKLESDLARCQSNFEMDTTMRGRNERLTEENKAMKRKLAEMEETLFTAQNRLEYLESMKKDIESDPNGDLILSLTELISEEKKKNKELLKEIEELKNQF